MVSVLTVGCLLVTTRLLATNLGVDMFGTYSVLRQILVVMEPFILLSSGIALTRCIAMSRSESETQRISLAGMIILLATLGAANITGTLFAYKISNFLLKDKITGLGVFIAFLVYFNSYFIFVYYYNCLRGRDMMQKANAWQIIGVGIVPMLISFLTVRWSSLPMVFWLGSIPLMAAIIPVIYDVSPEHYREFKATREKLYELLTFGIPRVPGALLYNGMLAFGPILANYVESSRASGYLVISQSFLKMIESGMEGFNRVALPAFSRQSVSHNRNEFKHHLSEIVMIIIDLGTYISIQLLVWAPSIIPCWLGENYSSAVRPTQILAFGIVPYLMYVTLRSILDAFEKNALNSKYVLVSCMTTVSGVVILLHFKLGIQSYPIGLVMGLLVLGMLNLRKVQKMFNIHYRNVIDPLSIFLAFLVGLVSYRVQSHYFFTPHYNPQKALMLFTAITLSALLYLIIFHKAARYRYPILLKNLNIYIRK
jgi:O-antigen/teichoic acid export membrane protein